jgi:hypothetical protein
MGSGGSLGLFMAQTTVSEKSCIIKISSSCRDVDLKIVRIYHVKEEVANPLLFTFTPTILHH